MPDNTTNLEDDANKEAPKRRGAVGMKRIHRAKDKEDIIELLTSDASGVFREIWKLLFFAAALGFKHSRREKLAAVDAGRGIDQSSFGNNPAWPGVLYLLGLAETDATEVLKATEEAEDERISIFEEYANGGLALLKEQFAGKNLSLDALLNFVQAESTPAANQKPDLRITI